MTNKMMVMILCRVRELVQRVYEVHQDLEKWREPKYTDIQRTVLSVQLGNACTEAEKWLRELEEELDE